MSRDPDRLEFRKANQPIAGVLFILRGAAVLLGPFLGEILSDIPTWVSFLAGLPFLLAGVWMVFGRSVIILDRPRRTANHFVGVADVLQDHGNLAGEVRDGADQQGNAFLDASERNQSQCSCPFEKLDPGRLSNKVDL